MIQSTDELARILSGTDLDGAESIEAPIPLGGTALALRLPPGVDLVTGWTVCREALEVTGRWPVASVCWSAEADGWADRVLEEDFFSRSLFATESFGAGAPPAATIAAAETVDLDAALDRRAERGARGRSFEEVLDLELATLRGDVGTAPDRAELLELHRSGEIPGLGDLERWLLRWEVAVGTKRRRPWWMRLARRDGYLEDFAKAEADYGEPTLLLLPTPDGWESLAYLHFWGAQGLGSPAAVALCRRWNERWGAELRGHFGILLHFRVTRPPETLDQALDLAWEQQMLAECTTVVPGVSLRSHADVLVGRGSWTLKDRP